MIAPCRSSFHKKPDFDNGKIGAETHRVLNQELQD